MHDCLWGTLECFGQQCQKQPSTKTAIRARRKMKSGLPNTGWCRRQPVTPAARNSWVSASSVSLFPRPRMRDITWERLALVKTLSILNCRSRIADCGLKKKAWSEPRNRRNTRTFSRKRTQRAQRPNAGHHLGTLGFGEDVRHFKLQIAGCRLRIEEKGVE